MRNGYIKLLNNDNIIKNKKTPFVEVIFYFFLFFYIFIFFKFF